MWNALLHRAEADGTTQAVARTCRLHQVANGCGQEPALAGHGWRWRGAGARVRLGARCSDAVETGLFVFEHAGAVDEEHVQVDVEVQRRALRGRRPQAWGSRPGRYSPQSRSCPRCSPCAGDAGPRVRGLSRRVAGDAFRHRHEDGRPGRDRLPQGPDCRRRVLGRRRLPERPGVSRACLGIRVRSLAQRGHGRRARGHPDDALRGDDETSPQPDRGGVRSLGPAEDQEISRRLRVPEAAGTRPWRSGWTAPARRRS